MLRIVASYIDERELWRFLISLKTKPIKIKPPICEPALKSPESVYYRRYLWLEMDSKH